MPRRQFQADLAEAIEGLSIAGVSDVRSGTDDGEFTFSCVADGQQLGISVLIPELSDYPSSHTCMIYGAENASTTVAATLDDITNHVIGKTIYQILELVSRTLASVNTNGSGDQKMINPQEAEEFKKYEEDDLEEDEYFPGDDDMLPRSLGASNDTQATLGSYNKAKVAFRRRIQNDLFIAKSQGFKVGHQGGLMDGLACYVSLSVRIAKLGISEEAMQAWQLEPSDYLVVIFHYPEGYKCTEDLVSYSGNQAKRTFAVRVGISTTYKPTMQEAIQIFTVLNKEQEKHGGVFQQTDTQRGSESFQGFRNSFISRPLKEMLDQRLHMLIKYRYDGMSWRGAERLYHDRVHCATQNEPDISNRKYYEEEHLSAAWPKIVTDDHIQSLCGQEHSLPLIGMQFVLRHFVRCTEFCLVCFTEMSDDLQAIKPYVCDNPLCLYQYMSLGFGPSIEHEILSQPKVVDLLVSFCYASARLGRLRDFPVGLSLAVPPSESIEVNHDAVHSPRSSSRSSFNQTPKKGTCMPSQAAFGMKYSASTQEMLFEDELQACPVVPGNWIVIRTMENLNRMLHCRVTDMSLYPSVKVSEPIVLTPPENQSDRSASAQAPASQKTQQTTPIQKASSHATKSKPDFVAASFFIYNQNFDDLSDERKRLSICDLLGLLPPISEMRRYLQRTAQLTLSSWVDRLSPTTLGILRWIIASNRACIVQVDGEDDVSNGRKSEERLYGMAGWAQFRFAMGAPDKERIFVQAVRTTTERLGLRYPTLFAWHGSPIQNWHSIIREGLHFRETIHGRAFGNGVYHALSAHTSLGYAGLGYGSFGWPASELKVQQALALNEIVNACAEFVSQNPHLVVAQLDWIQTRYLFVKTKAEYGNSAMAEPDLKPLEYLEQDPSRTPCGVSGDLVIPVHAIAASRRSRSKSTKTHKRRKSTRVSQYDAVGIEDDDSASVATLAEDQAIFATEDECSSPHPSEELIHTDTIRGDKGKSRLGSFASSFGSKIFGSKPSSDNKSLTDYVPGTLNYSTLPMLQMPSWADTVATKRLMRDFAELIQIQNKEPPHQLGWHVDEDHTDNIYQWIVELHSFDSALPLAQDMKKQDIKSIVLEMRFGKDYPMSPPFVRVIRPRFLGFQQGGGGHVTAGGAMCMQLLTNDGWTAVSSIESILLQVRMAMSSLDPNPARLQSGRPMDYGIGEAVEAYIRACNMHGWTIPLGFREMALGGSEI